MRKPPACFGTRAPVAATSAGAANLPALFSRNGENVSLSLSKHRQTVLGWSADEVTDDNGDGTYQSFARLACTRVYLVNLKTGKVAGLGGADDIVVSLPGSSVSWAPYIDGCFSLGSVHSIRILRVGVLAVTIDLHDIAGCASCGGPLGRAHQLKSATTEIRRS